jgi:hypothetical protein
LTGISRSFALAEISRALVVSTKQACIYSRSWWHRKGKIKEVDRTASAEADQFLAFLRKATIQGVANLRTRKRQLITANQAAD